MLHKLAFIRLVILFGGLVICDVTSDEEMDWHKPIEDADEWDITSDIPHHWVDPTDMLNYNTDTQTMKKKEAKNIKSELDECERKLRSARRLSDADPDSDDVHVELNLCNNQLTTAHQDLLDCKTNADKRKCPPAPLDHTYIKQFTRVLLNKLAIPSGTKEEMYFQVTVKLRPCDVDILQSYAFGMDHGNIQDAHNVLSHMIQSVSQLADPTTGATFDELMREEVLYWVEIAFKVGVTFAVVTIGLFLFIRLDVSWSLIFFRLLMLFLIISFPWNWWHMYLGEVADRHSKVMRDLPAKCVGSGGGSWWDSITSALSISSDECSEYHRALMVDPMWEVPPTKAIAVTITKFAVEPLEHIGVAIRKFLLATLRDVPFYYLPFFFGFATILIFLVIIMGFGYKIRVFHFFGVEPARQPVQAADERREKQLLDRIGDLERENTKLSIAADRLQAIETLNVQQEKLGITEKKLSVQPIPPPLNTVSHCVTYKHEESGNVEEVEILAPEKPASPLVDPTEEAVVHSGEGHHQGGGDSLHT